MYGSRGREYLFCICFISCSLFAGNFTPTYDSIIKFYESLDKKYSRCKLVKAGKTDIGEPLHVFILSANNEFEPKKLKEQGKLILLINNGIHPGEPDGINACMEWSRDLLKTGSIPKDVVILIIPTYNVGGTLNRSCCSRANQFGPEEYGFRGNAQNLDLNRDFIKCDSKNAESFTKLFRKWDPHILVDTHVSNGADYQYTLTLIHTQRDKLGGMSSKQMDRMDPLLQDYCTKRGFSYCPYVNTLGETPESGIVGYMETPRYSTGYAALYSCIGYVVETHMLKPFDQRVKATRVFLEALLDISAKENANIRNARNASRKTGFETGKTVILDWQLDTAAYTLFDFLGFRSMKKKSEVTGLSRLFYDTTQQVTFPVKYFNTYSPSLQVERPLCYVIPQAWDEVIRRLEWNKVPVKRLKKDSTIRVEVYYIGDIQTGKNPYEGHYLHSNIQVRRDTQNVHYYKGDYLVYPDMITRRFAVETLEPQAPDSYFAWGFFDAVLQQKEWFSDYVFEEKAKELLDRNAALKEQFEKKKASDPVFAADAFAQLYFIYLNSPYYESSHRRYPVARVTSLH
ncbi:MAG: hypothetical protein IT233_04680 [Bacteroidia bacterium]|nr:hypothetical protein [Bacteroidia bacterium]